MPKQPRLPYISQLPIKETMFVKPESSTCHIHVVKFYIDGLYVLEEHRVNEIQMSWDNKSKPFESNHYCLDKWGTILGLAILPKSVITI